MYPIWTLLTIKTDLFLRPCFALSCPRSTYIRNGELKTSKYTS